MTRDLQLYSIFNSLPALTAESYIQRLTLAHKDQLNRILGVAIRVLRLQPQEVANKQPMLTAFQHNFARVLGS